MFLKRVVLKNVRCIRDAELSFLGDDGGIRKWTLLLGENGCGKSTILRSIALVLAGSETLPAILGEADSWIRSGCKSCHFKAEVESREGKSATVRLVLREGQGIADVLRDNEEGLKALDEALGRRVPDYFMAGYGVSRRLAEVEGVARAFKSRSHLDPRAEGIATLFFADAPLNPLQQWVMSLHYRRGAVGLKMVRDALARLLPGLKLLDVDRDRGDLLFRTPDGTVPLSQLSDGYQNVAAWCGDLLFRITQANLAERRPLQAAGLLLVDEIGLHLHPLWQRRLRGYLSRKLPNFQIVATTHSLLTAQQVDEGELYILQRPEPSASPFLEQFPGVPRHLMLHQLAEPLFGIPTVDSTEVEDLKTKYRLLRDKKRRTKEENERLQDLKDRLADIPDWSRGIPQLQQHEKMMAQVLSAIEAAQGRPEGQRSATKETDDQRSAKPPPTPRRKK